MRLFEIIFILSFIILINYYYIRNKDKKLDKILFLSVIFIVILSFFIHLIYEGLRWQMIPLIIIPVFAILFYYNKYNKLFIIISNFIFLLVIILMLLFPIKKLSFFKTNYEVGTYSFNMTDESRDEKYGNKDSYRKLRMQIWYPIDKKGDKKAKWFFDGKKSISGISKYTKLPDFLLNHLRYVKSNSYLNERISDEKSKYPLIVISHGWSGFRNIHTNYAETLASEGYIVIGINHTYGAVSTVFENKTEYIDYGALPSNVSKEIYNIKAKQLIKTYSLDVDFVINNLNEISSNEFIKNKIDSTRIGLIGHSTGGGGVVYSTINNKLIDAMIGFDVWIKPLNIEDKKIDKPFMLLNSDQWKDNENYKSISDLLANSHVDKYNYRIKESYHQDFTLLYMLGPLVKYTKNISSINPKYNEEIQIKLITNFFNKYLKKKIIDIKDIKYNILIDLTKED